MVTVQRDKTRVQNPPPMIHYTAADKIVVKLLGKLITKRQMTKQAASEKPSDTVLG